MTAQLVYSSDLDTSPPDELVKGMIPRGPAVGIAYGPPHCGKSFVFSTELPLMIAAGRPFLCRDVIQGRTCLAVGEGMLDAGVRKAGRLDWQAAQDATAGTDTPALTDEGMLILTESFPLAINREGNLHPVTEKIISELEAFGDLELLVLDSLGDFCKSSAVSNESSATRLMDGAKQISQRLGCLVLLIHHTTKAGDAMLGADRLRASADLIISVQPEQGGRESSVVTCEKMRYGPRFAPFAVEALPHSWDEPARDTVTGELLPGETYRASTFVTRLRTDAGAPVARPVTIAGVPRPVRRNGVRPNRQSIPDQLAAARTHKDLIVKLTGPQCPDCGRLGGGMGCDVRMGGSSKLIPLSLTPTVLMIHSDRVFAAWETGRITEEEYDSVMAKARAA